MSSLPSARGVTHINLCMVLCFCVQVLFFTYNIYHAMHNIQSTIRSAQYIVCYDQCTLCNFYILVVSGQEMARTIHNPLNRADTHTISIVSSDIANRDNVHFSESSSLQSSTVVQLFNINSCGIVT